MISFQVNKITKKIILLAFFAIIIFSQPTWTDNCLNVNNISGTCTQCMDGFYLEYFLCLPCAPLCICTSQYNYCQTCMIVAYKNTIYNLSLYFHEVNNRCYFCDQWLNYCLACNNQSICTQCYGGYYPVAQTDSNGRVSMSCTQKCQGNLCQICINSTSCQLCSPGYYLDVTTGLCSSTQCSQNCIQCQTAALCKNCTLNYFLNLTTNTCQYCNISYCAICTNATYCNNCTPGYYSSGGTCISTGFNNCVVYIGGAEQATGCQVCEPGYFVLASNCNQCVGCLLCSLQFLCQSKCYDNATPFNYACLVPTRLYQKALNGLIILIILNVMIFFNL